MATESRFARNGDLVALVLGRVGPLTESTYYPRVDGVVGTELVLLSTGMYVGLNTPIEQFLFTLTLGT